LPAAARRQLGIDFGDKVAIVIEDEEGARLRRVEHDVRYFDELIEEAMADHADQFISRLGEETR
jgi:bifunctional DNA-binding transcriptional regulator/antitoxin component of YhaV-PrlF toxin-antitoxin module